MFKKSENCFFNLQEGIENLAVKLEPIRRTDCHFVWLLIVS